MNKVKQQTDLARLLRNFFCGYLMQQRRLSSNTVSAYWDTFKLFLAFLSRKVNRPIAMLTLNDIDRESVIDFLQHLEVDRGNGIRTRNNRLAAIRTFFNYVAGELPDNMFQITQILAIPQKRWNRPLLGHLERDEMEALITSIDTRTWSGERDQTMLLLLYNTGARVSEVTPLQRQDVDLCRQHAVHFLGKGRKERVIPLWQKTVRQLKAWLIKIPLTESGPLFPNRFGDPLTRSGVRQRLLVAQQRATKHCPSLSVRKITPHTLRHYVPFLTMSCNVKGPIDMLGNCRLSHAEPHPNTRHSFPGYRLLRKASSWSPG